MQPLHTTDLHFGLDQQTVKPAKPVRGRTGAAIMVAAVLTVTLAPNANAFWGIGDVTFDPSNYAVAGKNLAQLQQMYETLSKQFDRMDKMQQTISRAAEAYDRLTNLDLHAMADSLKPGQYMKSARGLDGIQAARAEMNRMKGTVQGNAYFINDQLARLNDLENMVGMQAVSANNAKDASTDLDQRRSSQIVAQSTSVLAALASAEEQRRQQQAIAESMELQRQKDLSHKSVELFDSLAGQSK